MTSGRKLHLSWKPMRNAFSPMIRCVAKILPIIIRTCRCICNELGKGRPRLETGTTDDGLLWFLNNRHNPVMVYNDLMIRYISVHNYSKDRSQPVTIQCIHTWVGAPVDRRRQTGMICPQPYSDLGSDYGSFLPYGF